MRLDFLQCTRSGLGPAWPGMAWLGLAWPGKAWFGLAWPGGGLGCPRPGLAWPGLAWLDLAWLGLPPCPTICLSRQPHVRNSLRQPSYPPCNPPRPSDPPSHLEDGLLLEIHVLRSLDNNCDWEQPALLRYVLQQRSMINIKTDGDKSDMTESCICCATATSHCIFGVRLWGL